MVDTNILVAGGTIASAALGTGGVGYAIAQAWLRRNDSEVKANAAKVLTDAAGQLVTELRTENKELRAESRSLRDEMRSLREIVTSLIEAVDEIVPLLRTQDAVVERLQATLKAVRREI